MEFLIKKDAQHLLSVFFLFQKNEYNLSNYVIFFLFFYSNNVIINNNLQLKKRKLFF